MVRSFIGPYMEHLLKKIGNRKSAKQKVAHFRVASPEAWPSCYGERPRELSVEDITQYDPYEQIAEC